MSDTRDYAEWFFYWLLSTIVINIVSYVTLFSCRYATTGSTKKPLRIVVRPHLLIAPWYFFRSGAIAERAKTSTYVIMTLLITGFAFPFALHWVDVESGWLTAMGFYDAAGGVYVHWFGACAAFGIALALGPRSGRFSSKKTGRVLRKLARSSDALTFLGSMLLWLALYGVAAMSPVFLDEPVEPEVRFAARARPLVVTTLSAASSVVATLVFRAFGTHGTHMVHLADAAIGGVVAAAAGCNIVEPWVGIVAGVVVAPLIMGLHHFVENTCKVDDVCNVISGP